MTKEEQLKQEAEEYAEGMAKYYASTHEGYIPSQFEKYLRKAYISSAEPKEKRIAELKAQLEKTLHALVDLLWFEDNLDHYMYECDDAQNGELLKPFSEARNILKAYECKKCKGEGTIFTKKYHLKITCPVCKGASYIFGTKETKENEQKL